MIILSETNDDKGRQLERLTGAILQSLQYRNVTFNEAGSGGNELDVRAEYVTPVPGGDQVTTAICECKAERAAADLPKFLKFLGKIYFEHVRSGREPLGCFIALNGVNGPVSGMMRDLAHARKTNIRAIAGDDLFEIVSGLFGLCSTDVIRQSLPRHTDRKYTDIDLAYYDQRFYWIIEFDGPVYAVFNADGSLLSSDQVRVISLVGASRAGDYVDLGEEQEAKRRRQQLNSSIIAKLMLGDGELGLERLCEVLASGYNCDEIKTAVDQFNGWLAITQNAADDILRLPMAGDANFARNAAQNFLILLAGPAVELAAIGCSYYDRAIDEDLIGFIVETQTGLQLSDEDREQLVRLLRISPSALQYALVPEEMIVNNADQFKDADQDDPVVKNNLSRKAIHDRDYFFAQIFGRLANDYMTSKPREYFYVTRQLQRIDTVRSFTLSFVNGAKITRDIPAAYSIGQLTPELGGTYVLLSCLPEPVNVD